MKLESTPEKTLKKIFSNSDRRLIKEGCTEFEKIPGVGKKLSKDFIDLGYHKVIDLNGEDPELIYQNLIELRGRHIDRCVLYVFRCAVYYASNTVHEPELLKWWNWKDTE